MFTILLVMVITAGVVFFILGFRRTKHASHEDWVILFRRGLKEQYSLALIVAAVLWLILDFNRSLGFLVIYSGIVSAYYLGGSLNILLRDRQILRGRHITRD